MKLFIQIIILIVLIGVIVFLYIVFKKPNEMVFENSFEEEEIIEKGTKIVFVGDIMLDRGVEYVIEKENNFFYPFEKVSQFLNGFDIVFGNLEGPISENPVYFSDESLKFSFSSKVIDPLVSSGFNIVSLANNHTLNMGQSGLEETKELLGDDIVFTGDPITCLKDDIYLFEQEKVLFFGINVTFPMNCGKDEIVKEIMAIKQEYPDYFLILAIHWGNEYEDTNSFSQQELAYAVIDAGADLIIGSHPHVVQNIDIYKDKLIFYSLGNFIFDQTFSKETQQGLAIGLEILDDQFIYTIYPIQSKSAQPFLMEESDMFLNELSKRSSDELYAEINKGEIKIDR